MFQYGALRIYEPRVSTRLFSIDFDDGIMLCLRKVREMKPSSLARRVKESLALAGMKGKILDVFDGPDHLFDGKLRPAIYVRIELSEYVDNPLVTGHRDC